MQPASLELLMDYEKQERLELPKQVAPREN